ncbi:hypothetical protein OIU34_19775 [Pararhizobium sp. BT-229]|uniref:hypothetical protein n=1 Tax=Pararhizobium sp. BT-229 TaxID=2986923 RepID=UPI0021F7FD80|nr:hypothetical protein [Pararhizobium sp. BT-229]MCV9964125.1 hypothetical protein [Pararhizobium sp. BT-229]
MIFDDALASRQAGAALSPLRLTHLNAIRYKVKRFVFDEDASAKAGRFSTECADLVCEHAEFAIPPFYNTYIEIDQHASLRASSRRPIEADTASRVGYLFLENGDLLVCAGDDDNATFLPFLYQRREGGSITAEEQVALRNFLMGEVAEELRPAIETFSHRLTSLWEYRPLFDMPTDLARFMQDECRGDLKRAIAAVLLLNQQHGVAHREVGPRRAIRSGKAKTYLAHSVVTIDLSPGGIRGLFTIGNRASPRRHQVEGHYVHYNIADGCSHSWSQFTTPELERRDMERLGRHVKRWRCSGCMGLRVWREEFHRGDAQKGFVTKEYKVTDSGR